ncbi:tRNA (adenine(58)-N(1))-methyltransferase non-catalytic subunit trm6 [Cadophora gregata]|uniref:tRNA (adenine(58)-N(1))-methyltransferase non-catalytic subunit trm6 n=1 Tax=Cadophora gregata TaxID=51156 RepID=UPI0026DD74AD|nr:tRNA (adenine(58)-N(1))-methyltransferase non-catalytic subunit trm6 [Cadophora gregata]KAK0122504.1 tRNA (adenine(58)-N(1))-methyltransferase non-catalytic subunit trm6 [Cadophora gregata]KAK0127982.1 tRNA (adenine(58)-N(1))-methyltransferase non-catalytic subunit trm6 [Cadophora gregata f. sp. sojae]
MHSLVEPNAWVVLRLPSDTLKILQIAPNTIVSLGKYGTFSSNLLLGRPYNKTYELLDRAAGQKDSDLRIVPAAELHADTVAEEQAAANSSNGAGQDENVTIGGDGVEFQLVGENGEVIMRSNRETIDDAAQQTLTMEEIEELKREGTGAGKDLIAKLMASHLGIEQKTAFSLAKYKLLKTKKYLRRFTVLPVDVPMLIKWVMEEKDAGKIMEMREEMCALVGSWANVHFSEGLDGVMGGRWLVVDETGGLLVAALAERMGTLNPPSDSTQKTVQGDDQEIEAEEESTKPTYHDPPLATSNTITLIHNNAQPNLSLLKYFHYDPTTSTPTHPNHPLATHLHPISWLQLIDPSQDTTYSTPITPLSPTSLSSLKSGKRGTYYRKLRRHNRVTSIVDSTLAGGFDGLVVASHMDPISILQHTIPLLRGGAQVAIYSPTIESLVKLSDAYSTSRRTAFIQSPPESFLSLSYIAADDSPSTPQPTSNTPLKPQISQTQTSWPGNADFPLNPTLLLNTAVQSARIREWQVLPGRTHPVMTGRGGAEGYLFTGVRVIPAQGRVEARGKFAKKKVDKVVGKGEKGVVENGTGNGNSKDEVREEVPMDVDIGKRANEGEEEEMSPPKRVKLDAQLAREI